MYYLTGVQHTTGGDIAIPVAGYSVDGYKKKYHEEMAYAMNNAEFLGLSIIVFNGSGSVVLSDNWVRTASENEG